LDKAKYNKLRYPGKINILPLISPVIIALYPVSGTPAKQLIHLDVLNLTIITLFCRLNILTNVNAGTGREFIAENKLSI
jgi:hypothetical protein